MHTPDSIQLKTFESYRPLLFSIAYRMLASASDAEDMVQEAFLRYRTTPTNHIESPKAFLTTIITRLCINHLHSAKQQRETYIGPWLPEPVFDLNETPVTPVQQAELHESLSLAFLTLLEQLTPLERAVFLLREVFDYDYGEIASITGQAEAACRQMLSRARKHIADNRPRFKPSPEAHRQILGQFIEAVGSGDLDGLMQLLSNEVTLWADGGGKTRGAAIHPLHNPEVVGKFLIASPRFAEGEYSIELTEVNGELCVVLRSNGKASLVLSTTLDGDKNTQHISQIRVIGNPDKLKWLNDSK